MGIDLSICIEARINSTWTHLCCFGVRRDHTLFEALGYTDQLHAQTPPPEWTAVSKWLFEGHDGHQPTTLTLDQFRAAAEQRRLDQPRKFDLRPGFIPPFQEWLEQEVQGHNEPTKWNISGFLGTWSPKSPEHLGSEIRLCVWYS